MNAKQAVAETYQLGEGRPFGRFNVNNPAVKSVLSKITDVEAAADAIWELIHDESGNPDLAEALTPSLMKHHPANQRWRSKAIPSVQEERQKRRARREINGRSGGKVVFLIDRLAKAEKAHRSSLIASCYLPTGERHVAINSATSKLLSAHRAYWSEFSRVAKSVKPDWTPPKDAPDLANRPLLDFVLSLDELVSLELPERENIVYPFLPAQSLSMVFAPRGLGKSWFCMELAVAVAEGRDFLAWSVSAARRVLYIDGEMPQKTLVDRFRALSRSLPQTLDVLPSESLWTEDRPLNLNDATDQSRITALLDDMATTSRKPDLIIIDNLSSMTAGGDENSNSELDSLLRFLVGLRHKGFSIVLVHHTGKSGDQRGASRREDLLDTSIKLSPPKGDDTPGQGAKFAVEFVKTRGEKPDPDKLTVELVPGEHGGLEWVMDTQQATPAYIKAVALIRDMKPKTQSALADAMGVSTPRVSKLMQEARDAGLLEKGRLELTTRGLNVAGKFCPEKAF